MIIYFVYVNRLYIFYDELSIDDGDNDNDEFSV